jgi:hypothetical protein
MSLLPGAKRAQVKRERQPEGWYTEPRWCDAQLFASVRFKGPIHDPCCGEGRIPEAAIAAGYTATGSDLMHRGYGTGGVDFHKDNTKRTTLIFNPPSNNRTRIYVDPFIHHALDVATDTVAIIVPAPFLCGRNRFWDLYKPCPPALVLACAQRPSMPPGGENIPEKGGTADYIWLIWSRRQVQYRRQCGLDPASWWHPADGTVVDWLRPLEE